MPKSETSHSPFVWTFPCKYPNGYYVSRLICRLAVLENGPLLSFHFLQGDQGTEAKLAQGFMGAGTRSVTSTVSSLGHLVSSRTGPPDVISDCGCFHLLILPPSWDSPSEIESQHPCPPESADCWEKHPVSSTMLFPTKVASFQGKKYCLMNTGHPVKFKSQTNNE